MIKNIVFDIGNVLVSFQPHRYYKEMLKEDCATICDAVFASSYWKEYDNGLCSLDEVKRQLLLRDPDQQKAITLVIDNWFSLMKPIPEMWQLREDCRANGYGIYIISNLSKDSYDYLQKSYRLFDALDGRVLSFEEKIGKPDPRMFERLCARYALAPAACLFLDDQPANIQAAKQLGMQAIHVVDTLAAVKEAKARLC